jgi:dephospho-CoA kinase
MIIGITGTLVAGKGTIVNFLKKEGFKHYSVSDFLKEEIKKRNMKINRDSMVFVANDLREKYSLNYIVEELYNKAKNFAGNSIIESLRNPGEIFWLKNQKDFYLFAVDANQKTRYERAVKRESEKDKITFEKFIADENREMQTIDPSKQNLGSCIEMADYKFENDGTIEELKEKVEKVLKEINSKN